MYKYYVFISYSRKDSRAAAYLQRQLEHFRIPVKLVPKGLLPAGQKFLRPVFRDKRDLENSERSFTEDIKRALESSHYLLVLCSPNSADSPWVDEEIRYFLKVSGNDFTRVVPVILDGSPLGGSGPECLPSALRRPEITTRNLPTMIPDEGEPLKDGWENGLVQSLSYMLKVDREKIKATVDREKLRQAKIYAVIGLCVSLIFAALTVWAIRAERIADRNEKRAIAGEKRAIKNAELARKNEAEAKANEQRAIAGEKLAKKNEAEAIKNKKRAEEGEKRARENEAKAKANEQRAIAGEKLAKDNAKLAWKNETIAKKQAEIAKKSLLFLSDIFRSANPAEKGGNKDLKVLDAIKRKLPEIPKLTPWQLRASVSRDVALILIELGEYDTSLSLIRDALKLYESHDSQSISTAACYNDIGVVYRNQGKYIEAVKFHKKSLAINLKKLGENHPYTAAAYNNIGLSCDDQGKYDEAISFYQKSLAINLRLFGRNSQKAAANYSNIGIAYWHQCKYDKAIFFHKKALAIYSEKFGANHPRAAFCYNNIGSVYSAQGKYNEAISSFENALEICKKKFGENHPDTAICYNNIGSAYHKQGHLSPIAEWIITYELNFTAFSSAVALTKPSISEPPYEKALKFYKKALEIRLKILGEYHPDTAASYNNIGSVFQDQSNFDEAIRYFRRALEIRMKTLGENHPDTANSYNNIGTVYWRLGQKDRALEYESKAVAIAEKTLGKDHPKTKLYLKRLNEIKNKWGNDTKKRKELL